jgi:protein-disulfide isomerase
MSQEPIEGSEPEAPPSEQPTAEAEIAASEQATAEPDTTASEQATAEPETTASEQVSASPPASGVTVPVAVPVTVALVLGLAIGLILGWVIPRPGDEAAAGNAEADTALAEGEAVTDGTADTAAGGEAENVAPTALDPAAPSPVPGGPSGTDDVAGLVVGESGPLVEVFEDYVCPFCARLELNAGADLREAALSGEYRLVVHPIAFLTEDSPRAANASACVYEHHDREVWVAFHEGVYERQDPGESVGQYSTDVLVELAEQVGAGADATTCITDETFFPWVQAITEQAFARGVRGTPTVTVDGTITDVAPLVQ